MIFCFVMGFIFGTLFGSSFGFFMFLLVCKKSEDKDESGTNSNSGM